MPVNLADCIIVAAGGALGCLSRYLLQHLPILAVDKTYHTMAVNIIGCLLIGLVATLLDNNSSPKEIRLLCVTGFLGGFTTYSTFTLDAMTLMRQGLALRAFTYVAGSFIGGIVAFLAGMFVGNIFKS